MDGDKQSRLKRACRKRTIGMSFRQAELPVKRGNQRSIVQS